MKLFGELDSFMDEKLPHSPVDGVATTPQRPERDEQIDRCLRSALHAYTARWLPLFIPADSRGRSVVEYDAIGRSCWRAARKDMLKVINRPSYRSVLALYLFGQTPVPRGISREEELDGISGVVCSQTALLHVQQLRERLRCCQFNGSEVSAWADTTSSPLISTQRYLNLETRAYWAAVIWDTSEAMTLNFRSSLSSGLKGACSEPVWQLTRAWLVGSFHDRTEDGSRLSEDVAAEVMSAASVCTVYTWRTVASLKEALREGVDEATVQSVWGSVLDALDVFRTTIHPLLSKCERQLHFLGEADRFHWYAVGLLHHLGVLLLADALEAAPRSDLLRQLADASLAAEHECLNVLKFGLDSTYTIVPSPVDSTDASRPVTVSFVAIDPHPHHVVAAVRLLDKAFRHQYVQGAIQHEAYAHLSSTLRKALDQLPQNSKAIQSAKENLQASLGGVRHPLC
jgi:hypothetical protein